MNKTNWRVMVYTNFYYVFVVYSYLTAINGNGVEWLSGLLLSFQSALVRVLLHIELQACCSPIRLTYLCFLCPYPHPWQVSSVKSFSTPINQWKQPQEELINIFRKTKWLLNYFQCICTDFYLFSFIRFPFSFYWFRYKKLFYSLIKNIYLKIFSK